MVKVFKIPPFAGIFIILGVLALILVSLPLFLFGAGVLLVLSYVRRALTRSQSLGGNARYDRFENVNTNVNDNAPDGVSGVIENKQIGAYRIKADERDPSVIEVVDP